MTHGLSCPTTCNLPRPGIEPVSPALAGGFLTAGAPGEPLLRSLLSISQQEIASMLSMLVSGRKTVGDFGVSFIIRACIFQILNLVYINDTLKNTI